LNVRQLRAILAAFDDDMEVSVAPQLGVHFVGRDAGVNCPHPLQQYEIKDSHVVGVVDQETLRVVERRVVLAFEQPESRPPEITDELRKKFISFREAYSLAQNRLTRQGAAASQVAAGAWEAANMAAPLTNEEIRVYSMLHVSVQNVLRGELMLPRIHRS
jgi:hypothetical protein